MAEQVGHAGERVWLCHRSLEKALPTDPSRRGAWMPDNTGIFSSRFLRNGSVMTWDTFLSSYSTWPLETGRDWAPAFASLPKNVARRWRSNTMATSNCAISRLQAARRRMRGRIRGSISVACQAGSPFDLFGQWLGRPALLRRQSPLTW